MSKFVLWEGDVWKLIRREHFGDETLWLLAAINTKAHWARWANANKCTLLDPALNILFEKGNQDE